MWEVGFGPPPGGARAGGAAAPGGARGDGAARGAGAGAPRAGGAGAPAAGRGRGGAAADAGSGSATQGTAGEGRERSGFTGGELPAPRHARHHGPALSDGVPADARQGHHRHRGVPAGAAHLHRWPAAARRSGSEIPRHLDRPMGRRHAGRGHGRLLAAHRAGPLRALQRRKRASSNASVSRIPTR